MSSSERPRGNQDWYEERLRGASYLESRHEKARVIAALCRGELRAANRIADLGSGTGIIKQVLETEFSKPIVGFEIDRDVVVEGDRMVRADILRLPVADGGLDFLLMNHVYEHVTDHRRLFGEAYRVLAPGGRAYVSAGNRYVVIEPHYRLPFLSWLPSGVADLYLRASRRGSGYDEIRYLGYRSLLRAMLRSGFHVRDITRRAIDDLIAAAWGPRWEQAWRSIRRLPDPLVDAALRLGAPQWFFILEKPA